MNRRTLAAAAAACLGLAALATTPAGARTVPPPDSRLGALMQVSIVDRSTGRELPVYRHRGEYWVAGTPGARYAIRVRNTQGERLMAVMSVDGVNVVSGETAALEQNGYVLDAGERADIAGWRKSDAQVAAFEFTAQANAYASRTGRPDDVGVIGVAVFRERAAPVPQWAPPVSRGSDAANTPGAERERRAEAAPPAAQSSAPMGSADAAAKSMAPAAPAPSLGTGHGRRETSHVGHTRFERASRSPQELIRIRYDSRENLVAAGVIPSPPPRWPSDTPSPFPGSSLGYVPDPPARY
ncbi:MAG: hypothetical protein REJ24_02145 [Rhodocyclaceae bacterium]|nr:hypothetical protein [Rhodocyclaceae bacterium]